MIGHFTVPPEAGLGLVYFQVAFLAAVSLVPFATVQSLLRFTSRTGIRMAAAAAAGLYYWFVVPSVIGATEAT